MKMTLIIAVLALGLAGQDSSSLRKPLPVKTSLCSIVAAPSKYDQALVVIRGELIMGREVFMLQDEGCTDRLRTGDHVWPPAIWLTPPNDNVRLPAGYELDRGTIDQFNEAVRQAHAEPRKWKVLVTLAGKIDSRQRYFGSREPNGQWVGNGFGNLNYCSAQLVYMSVSDWVITPREEEGGASKKP